MGLGAGCGDPQASGGPQGGGDGGWGGGGAEVGSGQQGGGGGGGSQAGLAEAAGHCRGHQAAEREGARAVAGQALYGLRGAALLACAGHGAPWGHKSGRGPTSQKKPWGPGMDMPRQTPRQILSCLIVFYSLSFFSFSLLLPSLLWFREFGVLSFLLPKLWTPVSSSILSIPTGSHPITIASSE